MRPWFGAGMLMGPGDAAAPDYPEVGEVQAGVVYADGALEGTYVGEQIQITVTVELPTIEVEVS